MRLLLLTPIIFMVIIISSCGSSCDCSYPNYQRIKLKMTKNQVEEILKTVPFKEKRNPNNRDFEMELIGCSYLCENDKIYIVYDEKLRVTDLNYGYTEFSR